MQTFAKILALTVVLGVTVAIAGEGHDQDMPTNLLFIHHSCGGQLLADPGQNVGGSRDSGERCIYASHTNGGGLRSRLEAAGFQVNEASYGSIVGEDTDICHWHVKFATQMDRILVTQRQDVTLPAGQANAIDMFKSCYPNNRFIGQGSDPGDPDDCELTLANAKAAYRSLLPLFGKHPDVLFVSFTAPPMAEYKPVGWQAKIKSWFSDNDLGGDLAREFNTWLVDREEGWLAGYDLPNVAVFDHYDVLTAGGATNYSAYPTHDGRDSHPSSDGNNKSATAFMPFLEAAVAGMDWPHP